VRFCFIINFLISKLSICVYKNLESIIFGLDGTPWYSSDVVLKAWDMFIEHNDEVKAPTTREAMESIMGLQAHQT
jgi:hypothetical protein